MSHLVALLRAVNLGPHNKASSADLKALAGKLKLAGARTLLASGNLIFRDGGQEPTALERLLEKACEKELGLRTGIFVRDAAALEKVIEENPFPEAARKDPHHLLVLFMKSAPGAAAVKALRAAIVGPEEVAASGKHVYLHYPVDIGHSKLTNRLIEKHLGGAGTGRNWNTVGKLLALARE